MTTSGGMFRSAEDKSAYGLVNKNQGIQARDAPDGELDDRTTSRAQRDVWKKKMYLASKEDQDRYLFLKSPDCTERGRETSGKSHHQRVCAP